ncbi:MAG: SDR family oxidoreductase [Sphingomonadales bacterium]|nr:MAG: SDR family oxidoreductase [Sphingomonadales bacterium]
MSNQDFTGKVIVITGGGAGFGEAFAHAFADRGAAVALFDIDDAGSARVAKDLEAKGATALAVHCDVGDADQVEAGMAKVAEMLGGIDMLINNAGLHLMKYARGFGAITNAETRRLFEVNVIGVVQCTLAARPYMAARGGGSIVNIASIASYMANSPYGVSKLAVRGLTVAFATEFGPDKIRVNAISPGVIATPNVASEIPEVFEHFVNNLQLVKRRGEMEDIVSMMLYLNSDAAGFISGETIRVAGGYPIMIS